jgi:putative heme-binding domain-containing protein
VLPHLAEHYRVQRHQRFRTRRRVLHQNVTNQALDWYPGTHAQVFQSGQGVGHRVTGDLCFKIGMAVVGRPCVAIWFQVHIPYILCAEMKKLVIVMTLGARGLFTQHSFTPIDVEDGGRLYRANCSICHGAQGDGVPGIDLGHGKFRRAKSDDDIAAIIRTGIPGTAMPPNSFSDFQSRTIVAYLRSIASATTATVSGGNPARGKAIYEGKGNCASCHRIRGVGARIGPDLSDVGNLRLAGELERSVTDSDAEILPQNRHFRAVTKEGATITGTLLNEDKYSVQLLDSSGQLVSLKRATLREGGFVEKSPMPSYRDKLTQQELSDLVSYLVSLKGVEIQ